jgi:protein-histidine pros-kinase
VDRVKNENVQGAETQFRDLLESAPDAMVVVDRQGKIVLINAQTEKLFGYGRADLLGEHLEKLVPDLFNDEHGGRDGFFEAPRTRSVGMGTDLFGLRKDGSEFPLEISLAPRETPVGTLILSAIRDVSERKQFELRLREKNERELRAKNVELEQASLAKDRFLAGMSHELRTPLNAIIGFTGTLLMQLPGPLTAEQRKQLEVIQTSARHLISLINDILDLAKIESGKVELTLEKVNVEQVIAEIATALGSLASNKHLTLDTHTTGENPMITTDKRALHQILINLTNNAIKYTDSGSVRIELGKTTSGASVEIAVIDTGIGISPEHQLRLFRAFEQLDPSSTRRYDGAGLGLHLSQQLASLLGGKISVHSEPHKGSNFSLILPLK